MRTVKLLSQLLLVASLVFFQACGAKTDPVARIKNGKTYGTTSGLFRGKWWHYYERARSFADGGFWKEAESDLHQAIRQREDDQRRARTYGMHFIDYFPHCEMGVVLYQKALETQSVEMLQRSIKELERSIDSVKSAKAEVYLDKARTALTRWQGRSVHPPDITIDSPQKNSLTNAFSVFIKASVRDNDHFVRSVKVADKSVRIDVSQPVVKFEKEVPVNPGQNDITITATNLIGESQTVVLPIRADWVGPVIAEDGFVYDPSGLSHVVVNGKRVSLKSEQVNVQDLMPSLKGGEALSIEAVDRAGNSTTASIFLRSEQAATPSGTLFAANQTDAIVPAYAASGNPPLYSAVDTAIVKISLKDASLERTTYLDRTLIEGIVKSSEPGTNLMIKGKEGHAVMNLSIPRSIYHFNCLARLDEGDNWFDIRATSPSDKSDELSIKVERRIPSVKKKDARLKLAVSNFIRKETKDVEIPLSVGFEDRLISSLTDYSPSRFAKVKDLLPTEEAPLDEDTARKEAKEKGYQYILFGKIEERKNSHNKHSLILKARFEDMEGNVIVQDRDTEIFGEDIDKDNGPDKLSAFSEYMSTKLIDELPIIEGQILKKKDLWLGIDIGKDKKARKGIDLIVYELMEEPIPGFGHETQELGVAKIVKANDNNSLAKVYDADDPEQIEEEHHVITK